MRLNRGRMLKMIGQLIALCYHDNPIVSRGSISSPLGRQGTRPEWVTRCPRGTGFVTWPGTGRSRASLTEPGLQAQPEGDREDTKREAGDEIGDPVDAQGDRGEDDRPAQETRHAPQR